MYVQYIHKYLVYSNQVMLPHCEKLPPIGSKGSETCFRIGIPHMERIFEGILPFQYFLTIL